MVSAGVGAGSWVRVLGGVKEGARVKADGEGEAREVRVGSVPGVRNEVEACMRVGARVRLGEGMGARAGVGAEIKVGASAQCTLSSSPAHSAAHAGSNASSMPCIKSTETHQGARGHEEKYKTMSWVA